MSAHRFLPARRHFPLAAAPLLLLAACREPIRVYEVAKTPAPDAVAGASSSRPPASETVSAPATTTSSATPSAAAPALHWHPPATWREEPPSGFRRGSFKLGPTDQPADLSITAFPGPAGGLLDNVNRWRGQLALPALDASATPAEPLPGASMPDMLWVELDGGPSGILGGIVPHEGETWFFKLTGPAPTLAAAREEFRTFLLSIHPTGPRAHNHAVAGASSSRPPPTVTASPSPPASSATPSTPPTPATPAAPAPRIIPDHWEEKPASSMRVASFLVRGPDGSGAEADLSVVPLEGDGGGLASNLNRWRGQLALEPWPEARLPEITTPVPLPGGDGVLVDFVSEKALLPDGSRARILGIITTRGSLTWFFKMTGHDELVAAQRPALIEFAQRFPLPSGRP